MSGLLNNSLFLSTAAAAGGYQIERSLRFNNSDSGYCSRTPAVAGNRKTWTWAGWVKRSALGAFQPLFVAGVTSNQQVGTLGFSSAGGVYDKIDLNFGVQGVSTEFWLNTIQLFRDPSAWQHIVCAVDTTQATASNRVRLYVNGIEITALSSFGGYTQYPSLNYDTSVNNTVEHLIGRDVINVASGYFSGYLAECYLIDGQQLTPSSFTEVSATTGQLIPKAYSGTYGTNGFQLKFADNSSNTAATLGKDTSGNSNNWTPNNLSVTETSPALFNAPLSSTPFTDGSASAVSITNNGSITASSAGTNSFNISNAANFPGGSTSGLTIGSSLNRTGLYTLDIYFKCTLAQQSRFFTNDGTNVGQGLAIATDGSINCYDFGNAVLASAGAVSANTWYHFRIIANNTAVLASYLNGAVQTTSGSFSNFAANTALRIGWGETSVAHSFAGQLGPVRFTAANLGKPPSGGLLTTSGTITNNPYAVNIAPGNDSLVDTPTSIPATDTGIGGEIRGNYCTWSPIDKKYGGLPTLSNGNLDVGANTSGGVVSGTFGVSSGKWYWEVTVSTIGTALIGATSTSSSISTQPGYSANSAAYLSDGRVKNNGSDVGTYSSYTTGDVIGVALNMDAGAISFYKNNSLIVTVSSSISGTWTPAVADWNGVGSILTGNFGQRAFAYTAPSGFKALCDTNLPSPVVAKPNTVMDVALYTGNGSTQSITGLAFSPDLVWLKIRNTAGDHGLWDVIRGTSARLNSASTAAEDATVGVTALNSDGFTVGGPYNSSSNIWVGWAWDAGTSTVSNTAGSITSQVRANVSAGFSIVTYTGNNTTSTVGHGLGVTPGLVIVKSRSASSLTGWMVKHSSLVSNYNLALNLTDAAWNPSTNGYIGNLTSSTTFELVNGSTNGNNANQSGVTYVAYCFAPVVGYSNGFSYTGNGSADGSFVYLGFRPRLILLKCSSTTGDWTLLDTAREGYNVDNDPLYPNLTNAEGTTDLLDITSNGFKLRTTDASVNSSGATYIGFAWAEAPFAYSRAR